MTWTPYTLEQRATSERWRKEREQLEARDHEALEEARRDYPRGEPEDEAAVKCHEWWPRNDGIPGIFGVGAASSGEGNFCEHGPGSNASGIDARICVVGPPPGGPSLLGFSCLSDPPSEPPEAASSAVKLPPGSHLGGLERSTARFRAARARMHRVSAAAALMGRAPEHAPDRPPPEPGKRHTTSVWHSRRSKGALERFQRVEACGRDGVVAVCATGCGLERHAVAGCGCGRACVPCRARQARIRQARFAEARTEAVGVCIRKGLFRKVRHGGRYSEKLCTLTVPHVVFGDWSGAWYVRRLSEHVLAGGSEEHGEAFARIALCLEAWRGFSLRYQAWTRELRVTAKKAGQPFQRPWWYRAFEWTPGNDRLGHPHWHIYFLSPFLPLALVRQWWEDAIAEVVGKLPPRLYPVGDASNEWKDPFVDAALAPRVNVDIREVKTNPADIRRELLKGRGHALKLSHGHGGNDVVRYADGWTIAEHFTTDWGEKIKAPLEVLARVYEALDCRRLVQTSRRFLAPRIHACPFCGLEGTTRVTIEKTIKDPDACASPRAARGPPASSGCRPASI